MDGAGSGAEEQPNSTDPRSPDVPAQASAGGVTAPPPGAHRVSGAPQTWPQPAPPLGWQPGPPGWPQQPGPPSGWPQQPPPGWPQQQPPGWQQQPPPYGWPPQQAPQSSGKNPLLVFLLVVAIIFIAMPFIAVIMLLLFSGQIQTIFSSIGNQL
jgi:hypothetical protein